MKYNPLTNTLYTDDNKLIKKMHCPYPSLKWGNLLSTDGDMSRFCSICESNVVETKNISDEALLKLLQEEPETCLKIDFNQENLRIVHHV
ncbi:hypothetical protein [Sulfurovum sp.]|uniref:hypothetical protein n=1 Tax=Sulfurovum sp. TaxID=1969726 RepID=UPI0035677B02